MVCFVPGRAQQVGLSRWRPGMNVNVWPEQKIEDPIFTNTKCCSEINSS